MRIKTQSILFFVLLFSFNFLFGNTNIERTNNPDPQIKNWIKTPEENKSRLKLRFTDREYINFKNFITREQTPLLKSFKLEQWLNVFNYDFVPPLAEDSCPVKLTSEIGPCPWNTADDLLMLKLKAKMVPDTAHPPINFVFLLDVSTSMGGDKRIELFKNGLRDLVRKMRDEDRISVVSYKYRPSIYFKSMSGANKEDI